MDKKDYTKLFGTSPRVRVVNFFINNDKFDYSMSKIARECGINRTTVKILIEKLLEIDFIKKTRKMGKSNLYKLNKLKHKEIQ